MFVGFNRCLCLEWRNDKGRRVEKADRVGLKLVRVMRICTPKGSHLLISFTDGIRLFQAL